MYTCIRQAYATLTVTQTSRILASLVLESEQLSRAPLYDDDDIDYDKTDTFKPWSSPSSNADILSLIQFSGDEDLQSRLRTLCTEFSDIFSNDLPKEPANIPPFKASAEELLRTDLLHMTTKEQNIHKEYLPDSSVLLHYRTGLPPTRLHTNWKGPMRVIKELNSRYTLIDLITGKEKDYHVSDMKPFVFDSAIVDPLDIARRDQMEFFIEKISDHREKLSQRKSHQFCVSWMGYDQSYDSWEPFANLRDSTILHSYLREKKLTQLIPTKFR